MEEVRAAKRHKIADATLMIIPTYGIDFEYVKDNTNRCTQCGESAEYYCCTINEYLCSMCAVERIFNL